VIALGFIEVLLYFYALYTGQIEAVTEKSLGTKDVESGSSISKPSSSYPAPVTTNEQPVAAASGSGEPAWLQD
jgi:hypothetical protein